MELQLQNQIKIKVYNVVLNYIQSHGWVNFDGFADDFTDEVLNQFNKGNFDLEAILTTTKGPFLALNRIKAEQFLNQSFTNSIHRAWNKAMKISMPVIRFSDIFPEVNACENSQAETKLDKLQMDEKIIQKALRDALREKGATPMPHRGKDSSVEIADIEDYNMKVKGREFSFTVVVKGYNSMPKANPKEIMHQITRAYITHPDFVLLVLAKEPVDFLLTQIKLYAKDVGNSNLVIIVPPIELVKFLIWRGKV